MGDGGGEGGADAHHEDFGILPFPELLIRCILKVSRELNISSELPLTVLNLTKPSEYNLSPRDNLNLTYKSFEDDLITQLLRSELWQEVNSSVWEEEGGMRLGDCLESNTPSDRPYLLPWWQQLTWTLAFGSMLLGAVGGNAIVMWIVIAHRRMRTVTNYFLVNLSAADLLMAVFNCIFNFIYMLHSDWPFGSIYCTISNFMANVTIAASVFTLMAISFDRYIAIVRPLKPRMSKSEARHFIVFIWFCSMSLAIPCLLYSTTVSIKYKNDEVRRGCFLLWPDGKTSISYREYVYNIVFFVTTYVLPMLVMLISYSLIGCELWGSHSIGEHTERQISSIKSKRRVVRMFIVIVVMFMLCWLPQQGFFLYQYHNSKVLDSDNIQHIYLGFYWLAMANAMINPIIYYWMNARFRTYFREVVMQCMTGRCCYCCYARGYLDSPHLTRRRHDSPDHTSRTRSALVNSRYGGKANQNRGENVLTFGSPTVGDGDPSHKCSDRNRQRLQYNTSQCRFTATRPPNSFFPRSVNGVRTHGGDSSPNEAQEANQDPDEGINIVVCSRSVSYRQNVEGVIPAATSPVSLPSEDFITSSVVKKAPFKSSQVSIPSLVGNAILGDQRNFRETHNDVTVEQSAIEVKVSTQGNSTSSQNSTDEIQNLIENQIRENSLTEENRAINLNGRAIRHHIRTLSKSSDNSLKLNPKEVIASLNEKHSSNQPHPRSNSSACHTVQQAIEETIVLTQIDSRGQVSRDDSNIYKIQEGSETSIQQEVML